MTDPDVIDDLVMARANAGISLASLAMSRCDAAHRLQARAQAALCELPPQEDSLHPLAGERQGVRGRGSAKRLSPSQVPPTRRGRWWLALCLLLAALFAGKALSGTPSVPQAPPKKAAVSRVQEPVRCPHFLYQGL